MRKTVSILAASCLIVAGPALAAETGLIPAQQLPGLPGCQSDPVSPSAAYVTDYRPSVDDPDTLGSSVVLGVVITYQCSAVTAAGAFVPEGYRVDLMGPCGEQLCLLGRSLLSLDGKGKSYEGALFDAVGYRTLTLRYSRTGNLVLQVRTRAMGAKAGPAANYLLMTEDRGAARETGAPHSSADPHPTPATY